VSSARARLLEEFGPGFTLESGISRPARGGLLARLRAWIGDYLLAR
jgi:hypothetical protein